MVTKIIKVLVKGEDVKTLEKDLKKVEEQSGKTSDALDGAISGADKATGGLITKMKGLQSGVLSVAKGFQTLRVAIIASGIGALVLAIFAVASAFRASEEGQNKFAKLMGAIGSVVGNVMDVVTDLGDLIIGLFSGDGEAIQKAKDFGKQIWNVIGLPLKNIKSSIDAVSGALKSLWDGDIQEAVDKLKGGINEINGNFDAAKKSIDQTKQAFIDFGEEVAREARIAQGIAQLRAMSDVKERELLIERAESNRDIAILREKAAQRERFSAKERIGFLEEAGRINDKIVTKEIERAQLLLEAKKAENNLSKSTKEDKLEEARLEAQVIDLVTQRTQLQRRLTTEIESAKREGGKAEGPREKQAKINPITGASFDAELEKLSTFFKNTFELDKANKDALLESAIESQNAFLTSEQVAQAKRIEVERVSAEIRERISEEEAQAKVQSFMLAANGFAAASQLIGQETAAGKAFAVASTLASTYLSAQQAYASQLTIPTPDAPVRAAIAAATAVAAGLANVKNILAVRVPGFGGGGGVGGGTPTRPPSFNVVANNPQNQLNQSLLERNNEPVQAFVVDREVTSAQEARRNKVMASSL